MDQESIAEAVKQICEEKGITLESVISTIEAALAAAYRKDFGEKNQNVKVEFNLDTGKSKIFDIKTVVDDVPEEELEAIKAEEEARAEKKAGGRKPEIKNLKSEKPKEGKEMDEEEEIKRFNPKTDIQISDAQKIKKSYKIDDEIKTELEVPGDFGRMAAQTAKQVIVQKLRETEREAMYAEFKEREGEILVGTIQRREGNLVLVDLGRLTALLPPEEQIRSETYTPGGHVKVFIMSVTETTKGPEVIVSRSHPEIVMKLFNLEIPEIANGTVEIKSIAREAGSRSKISVYTDQENIDPIGSCIGQRGARIQTIISELKGEKVDIIKYSDDPVEYITNALSPAKIEEITTDEESKTATAKVAEDQLSLAIGKAGQNVRLAAKLTGWKIDIISTEGEKLKEEAEDADEPKKDDTTEDTDEKPKKKTIKKEKGDIVDEKDEETPKKATKKKKKDVDDEKSKKKKVEDEEKDKEEEKEEKKDEE